MSIIPGKLLTYSRDDFRFSLRGLFVLILCITCGLAVAQPITDWSEVLLGVLTTAAILGLGTQVWDLFRSLRSGNVGPHRFSVILAISWRLSVESILVACCVCQALLTRKIIDTHSEKLDFYYGQYFPAMVWLLCLVVVLGSIVRRKSSRRSSRLEPFVNAAFWVAAAALAVLILSDVTLMLYLVYIAITGIELSEPVALQRPGAYADQASGGYRLFWISAIAAIASLLSATALVWTARSSGLWRRVAHTILLVAALVGTASYAWWFHFSVWPTLAPDLASAGMALDWSDWIAVVTIAGGLACWFAIALATADTTAARTRVLEWRHSGRLYLHERRFYAACMLLYTAWSFFDFFRSAWSGGGFFSFYSWLDIIHMLLIWLPNYLSLAIFIFSARILFRRRRDEATLSKETGLQFISARRFFVFFGLALVVVISGVAAIRGFSFAWWLGPWHWYSWHWLDWIV